MKLVDEAPGAVSAVSAVEPVPELSKPKSTQGTAELRECRNCGRKHEFCAFMRATDVICTGPKVGFPMVPYIEEWYRTCGSRFPDGFLLLDISCVP